MPRKEGYEDIVSLIEEVEDQDDPREGLALIEQRMAAYKEAGDTVPVELVRVRKALETDLILQSRGW